MISSSAQKPGITRDLILGRIGAAWGIVGFALLLGRGIYRLHFQVASLSEIEMGAWHWAAILVSVIFFGVGEGHFALQRKFIPRLLKKAQYLSHNPTVLNVLLAPVYCMGLIGWDRRTTLRSWRGVFSVIGIIFLVRFVPAPWYEIILVGVVAALAWACIYTLVSGFYMIASEFSVSDELAHCSSS